MKAMFAGFAAVALISACAYFGLGEMGFAASDVYAGTDVRLD